MQLLQGNCLELMQGIPEKSVDLVLCDLPYGMTDCEWDIIIPFNLLWEQYERVAKDGCPFVLFSAQPFTTKLIHSNLKHFKYCWYWKKNNVTGFTFAKYQPMRCIEDICVFYNKAPKYYPQGLKVVDNPRMRKKRNTGKDSIYRSGTLQKAYATKYTNYPNHLLHFDNEVAGNKNRLHPTQKPVALLEYLIKTYTDEGDIVLDNCMGSGSTGVAAMNTNREFIGIELTEHYYNIAKDRIEKARVS